MRNVPEPPSSLWTFKAFIYQIQMNGMLIEFPITQAFLDDVTIGGKGVLDCYYNMCEVIEKVRKLNLRIYIQNVKLLIG